MTSKCLSLSVGKVEGEWLRSVTTTGWWHILRRYREKLFYWPVENDDVNVPFIFWKGEGYRCSVTTTGRWHILHRRCREVAHDWFVKIFVMFFLLYLHDSSLLLIDYAFVNLRTIALSLWIDDIDASLRNLEWNESALWDSTSFFYVRLSKMAGLKTSVEVPGLCLKAVTFTIAVSQQVPLLPSPRLPSLCILWHCGGGGGINNCCRRHSSDCVNHRRERHSLRGIPHDKGHKLQSELRPAPRIKTTTTSIFISLTSLRSKQMKRATFK